MKFCAITPTRGDRPQFLEHCKTMIQQQTVKPDKHYIINYRPTSEKIDIANRIITGIEKAKADGFEFVFIIEDDDFYPSNYFENIPFSQFDFVGFETTVYYNIELNKYAILKHPGRSSLFCTGFNINALDGFYWPKNTPFIDIELWHYALTTNKKIWFNSSVNMPIGIKHGLGLCGGSGHNAQHPMYNNKDMVNMFLKLCVSAESYNFYIKLKEKMLCTKM